MKKIIYWSHFTTESRSAAGQRLKSLTSKLISNEISIEILGGGAQSNRPTWLRLIKETWDTVRLSPKIQFISLPPYRSAAIQTVLLLLFRSRFLVVDQRDMALASANILERNIERLLLRRANILIVTTHKQRRELKRRYDTLPPTWLIRNGASDDIAYSPPVETHKSSGKKNLKVLYQGLVGGKKLKDIALRLASLGCDLDLAVFLDNWSRDEINMIRNSWNGTGKLTIHANLNAQELVRLMAENDVAINPVPDHMEYAFTVKTADYAIRHLPQLAIGSRHSFTRRTVELCRLGSAIDKIEDINEAALREAIKNFTPRNDRETQVFRRETHAHRIIDLLRETKI